MKSEEIGIGMRVISRLGPGTVVDHDRELDAYKVAYDADYIVARWHNRRNLRPDYGKIREGKIKSIIE